MYVSEKSRVMRTPETGRREIEEKLKKMGDYVKIGYLSGCLKNNLDFDTKRFVLLNLTELYEAKKMFSDGAKAMKQAAEISATDQSKINDYMRVVELFIKGGNYDEADLTMKKALSLANTSQKDTIASTAKNYYLAQSEEFMKKDKRKQAAEVYERVLNMNLDTVEKVEVQKKLLGIYENLGKIREFYGLKHKMGTA